MGLPVPIRETSDHPLEQYEACMSAQGVPKATFLGLVRKYADRLNRTLICFHRFFQDAEIVLSEALIALDPATQRIVVRGAKVQRFHAVTVI